MNKINSAIKEEIRREFQKEIATAVFDKVNEPSNLVKIGEFHNVESPTSEQLGAGLYDFGSTPYITLRDFEYLGIDQVTCEYASFKSSVSFEPKSRKSGERYSSSRQSMRGKTSPIVGTYTIQGGYLKLVLGEVEIVFEQ